MDCKQFDKGLIDFDTLDAKAQEVMKVGKYK